MNKTSLDLRRVLIRMSDNSKSAKEISEATGIKLRTTQNYLHILKKTNGKDLVLTNPNPNTRIPSIDLEKLKQFYQDNPFAFDKEVGKVFGVSKSTVGKWRNKLGLKRKKAKTIYRESNDESKKNLRKSFKN
jgi:transposase